MDKPGVQVSYSDTIASIVLNDEAVRNAISMDMREELIGAINICIRDEGVSAITISGAGGHFCSGANIAHLKAADHKVDPLASWTKLGRLHDVVRLIVTAPKPIVAAVEGAAYGAGLSLALACDWVVASESARFCAAFAKLGMVADAGLIATLPQRVGPGHAREMLMTARVVGGDEARALGLSDALAPTGGALAMAEAKARELSAASPVVIAATKALLAQDVSEVMQIERILQPLLVAESRRVRNMVETETVLPIAEKIALNGAVS